MYIDNIDLSILKIPTYVQAFLRKKIISCPQIDAFGGDKNVKINQLSRDFVAPYRYLFVRTYVLYNLGRNILRSTDIRIKDQDTRRVSSVNCSINLWTNDAWNTVRTYVRTIIRTHYTWSQVMCLTKLLQNGNLNHLNLDHSICVKKRAGTLKKWTNEQ